MLFQKVLWNVFEIEPVSDFNSPVTTRNLLKLLFKRGRGMFTQIGNFENCFKISNYQDKNSNLKSIKTIFLVTGHLSGNLVIGTVTIM